MVINPIIKTKEACLFSLALILFITLFACEEPEPEEHEIWMKDGPAAWSPDGEFIAHKFALLPQWQGLYLIRPDGSDQKKLISGDFDFVDWSPDGKWLVGWWGDDDQVYKYNLAADSMVKLTDTGGLNYQPDWSPDGQSILYVKTVKAGELERGIWLMDSDGIKHSFLIPYVKHPDFEVEGKSFIYEDWPNTEPQGFRYREVYRFHFSDSSKTRLTHMPSQDCLNPTASPDGKYIVFEYVECCVYSVIYRIDTDGSNLTFLAKKAAYPAWSPDSQWIVYTDQNYGDGRLWKMRVDGSDKIPITPLAPDEYWETIGVENPNK